MPAGLGDAPQLIAAHKVLALNPTLLHVCDKAGCPTLRKARLPQLEMSLQVDPSAIEKPSFPIDFSVGEAGLLSHVAVCSGEGAGLLLSPSLLMLSLSNKIIDL